MFSLPSLRVNQPPSAMTQALLVCVKSRHNGILKVLTEKVLVFSQLRTQRSDYIYWIIGIVGAESVTALLQNGSRVSDHRLTIRISA